MLDFNESFKGYCIQLYAEYVLSDVRFAKQPSKGRTDQTHNQCTKIDHLRALIHIQRISLLYSGVALF